MKSVLVIKSSLNGATGNASKLAKQYVDSLAATHTITLIERDLAAENLPHLTEQEMQAWMTPENERNEEQHALAVISDKIVAQVQAADEIVLAVPMYNFGIPRVLKAWFDRLARAGITFKYTEQGPQGLLGGKKVTVMAARGGQYVGTPLDTQTAYVKNFCGFLGMTDVNFVYAEGLAMGEEAAANAWKSANKKILELI